MDDISLLSYHEDIPPSIPLPQAFQQAQTVEEKILARQGIVVNETIEIMNTEVNLGKYGTGWVHWYRSSSNHNSPNNSSSKSDDKKTLVLLHGYGGGSILFSKMIESLSETYHVCCVDLIGLSQSSRPTMIKQLRDIKAIVDFFTAGLLEWVRTTNIAKSGPFILAGHSFGGYIASWFMEKHAEYVDKLILISPAGMSRISKSENEEYDAQLVKNMNIKAKFFHFFRKAVWKYEITYEWLYTKAFFLPRKTILAHMIATRLKVTTKEETALWKDYYHHVLSLPEAASSFVYKLFMFPRVVAHLPLEELFERSNTSGTKQARVQVIYGDHDWMHRKGAIRLSRASPERFSIHILPDAGHHMNIDNPSGLSSLIKILP